MDVTKIPFNDFIGIENSDRDGYMLMLPDGERYTNHIGTVHASALFSLAEATSGKFLLGELATVNGAVAVVRKVETSYRKPARGKVYSSAGFRETSPEEITETLGGKSRALVKVEVTISDNDGTAVMQSVFEWFITVKR